MKKIISIALIFTLCLGFSVTGFADMMDPISPIPTLPSISGKFSAVVENPDGAHDLYNPDVVFTYGSNLEVYDISKDDSGITVVDVVIHESPDTEGNTESHYYLDINDLRGTAITLYYLRHPGDLIMKAINRIAEFFSSLSQRISEIFGRSPEQPVTE